MSGRSDNGELAPDPVSPLPTGRLPAGFTIAPDGIHVEHKAGEAPEWLCSPIAVSARFRAPDGGGWGRIIAVTNPDGAAMIATMLDRDLAMRWSSVSGELFDRGLSITSRPWGMAALKTLLTKWEPRLCKFSAQHLCWTDAGHTDFGPVPVSFRSFESNTRHQGDWIWQQYTSREFKRDAVRIATGSKDQKTIRGIVFP